MKTFSEKVREEENVVTVRMVAEANRRREVEVISARQDAEKQLMQRLESAVSELEMKREEERRLREEEQRLREEAEQEIARHEPDEEVQDLLAASVGLNLGMDFLPGAVGYDGVRWRPPVAEAAAVAWLDAYTANVDRTWRNPNLLVWHRELWAVDHGAALVFQHAWPPAAAWSGRVYDLSGHALAPVFAGLDAEALADVDTRLAARVTPELLAAVLGLVPDEWLVDAAVLAGREPSAAASRDRYLEYLLPRLEGDRPWRPVAGGPVATGGARAVPA